MTMRRVSDETVEKIISFVEEDATISLKIISEKLHAQTGLKLELSTVHEYLERKRYAVKILVEPCTMHNYTNKEKRAGYVSADITFANQGKTVIYIYIYVDETNVNSFLRRTQGRSRKGIRCCVKAPTSRGQNRHIISGISQTGLVY